MFSQKILLKFVKENKLITGVVIFVLAAAVIFAAVKIYQRQKFIAAPENQPRIYEALVNVVDQKTSDSVEDARSSLKAGDVIAYFPEGHNWSETEKNSYLIIKIKLRPDEAVKMTESQTKEAKKTFLIPFMKKGEEKLETIRARAYRLHLPDFDLQKFWSDHSQPFEGRVFSDSIIDKK